MKALILSLALLLGVAYGDTKISNFPTKAASTTNNSDALPFVDYSASPTLTDKKLLLSDIINLPSFAAVIPNTPFSSGSVIFANGGGKLSQDNAQFTWNDSSFQLTVNGGIVITRTSTDTGANRLQNKELDASSVKVVDPSDTSKKLLFSLSGQTSGIVTTIASSESSSGTLTLPSIANDTLVSRTSSDTGTGRLQDKDFDTSNDRFVDGFDTSKRLLFTLTGQSSAVTTTIAAAYATSGTLTLPNVVGNDTFVSRTSIDQGTGRLQDKDLDTSNDRFVDGFDTSKRLLFSLSSQTSGVTTTISAAEATSGTLNLPTIANDTLVSRGSTDQGVNRLSLKDFETSSVAFVDGNDTSKKIKFLASGQTSGVQTVLSVAEAVSGTLTFPAVTTDTLVSRTSTDTGSGRLQSKQFDSGDVFVDGTDTSKRLGFSMSGQTAGVTTTIAAAEATSGTLTLPAVTTDTLVSRTSTDTGTGRLQSKQFDSGDVFVDGSDTSKRLGFSMSGQTAGVTTTIAAVEATSGTLTLPAVTTDTLVSRTSTDTGSGRLTSKEFDNGDAFVDGVDTSKKLKFSMSGQTSGVTTILAAAEATSGTLTLPAVTTDTLVSRTSSDTGSGRLQSKQFDSGDVFVDGTDTSKRLGFSMSGQTAGVTTTIAAAEATSGTLTLPAVTTDTLVSRTSSDTLTNKTLSAATFTGSTTFPASGNVDASANAKFASLTDTTGSVPPGGFINMQNTDTIKWENGAANGAVGIGVNSSNQLTYFNGAGASTGFLSTTGFLMTQALPAFSGGDVTSSAGSATLSLVATSNSTLTTLSAAKVTFSGATGMGINGALSITGALTVGGNTTGDSNLGTISSVSDSAYYVGSFSQDFTGIWAATQTGTVNYVKHGKVVTLFWPSIQFATNTGSASAFSTSTTTNAFPSGLNPSGNTYVPYVAVNNNGDTSGFLRWNGSKFQFFYGTGGNFTNAATGGMEASSITYISSN